MSTKDPAITPVPEAPPAPPGAAAPGSTATRPALAAWRLHVLTGICLLGVAAALLAPRIAQDPAYHAFADTGTALGIPNFGNVASNLLFVLAGLFGLLTARRLHDRALRAHYLLLCAGAVLIGAGSAWYHHAPSTASLLWDRLPMTFVFMALFAAVIADRVSPRAGRTLLWPLVAVGVLSVLYWHLSEGHGAGDLRPYALVQFLPMVLIPLMLMLFPGRGLRARWLWGTLGLYLVAKACEHFDHALLALTGIVSGHSLKHVLSGIAVLLAVLALHRAPSGARCSGP